MNDDLSWQDVRTGAAEDLAPIEVDPVTGLPVPTVSVSSSTAQPTVWPWLLGFVGVLWILSRLK